MSELWINKYQPNNINQLIGKNKCHFRNIKMA